jgi:predicted dehydrogenase
VTIRFGIIGCGAISDLHAQALLDHGGVELVACADVVRSAAERSAARFGIPNVHTRPGELLRRSNVDAVVVSVPPKWHAELFTEALAEGKHVLIEKPLAMDLGEADRMIEASAASDRIVGVALVHRYLRFYQVLRDLIRAGAIGPVVQTRISLGCDMYGDSRFRTPDKDPRSWLVDRAVAGGGILMSSSIHFLSVASFVLGNVRVKRVDAKVCRLHDKAFPGIEDDVDLRTELAPAAEFLLHDSWVSAEPYRADFVGEAGRLTASGENWRDPALSGVCRGAVPEQYADCLNGTEFHAASREPPDSEQLRFGGLIADFVRSIEQGAAVPDMPDVLHARNMQAVVDAAYHSGRTGAAEDVDWRPQPSREPR